MAEYDLKTLLSSNSYPGRGIIIGASKSGRSALIAYFIMGRSANSRNRVFEAFDGGMRTKAFDESKMTDPGLIIYKPYLSAGNGNIDIITNGDQADTVYEFIKRTPYDACAFKKALATREFEPDAPNFTPRISGIACYCFPRRTFSYSLSIIKSNGTPDVCNRFFFDYTPNKGVGHFIHTYKCDGSPVPSFEGEPKEIVLPDSANELAGIVWENLNYDNKVSLFVREVPLDGNKPVNIIINKNQ